MSKIIWDAPGERLFETGVKHGVLYPQSTNGTYPLGVAWNGLTAVTESSEGGEANPQYADDIKYLNLMSAEEFKATIEALTYPKEFEACDGSAEIVTGVIINQQTKRTFGLCYRTALGNDTLGIDYGYKLHLVYGALAAPSEKNHQTQSDSPEAMSMSWETTTTPVDVPGKKPTAHIVIDSTRVDAAKLTALETILYGADGVDPRLPLPTEIIAIFTTGGPAALALSTINPADDATAVAVDSNIVLTFNNKVASESITITSATGIIVAGAKTWDAEGKVLTINPSESLTAATTYLVMVSSVTDIYGQTLAAEVKNFVTA